VFVAKLTEARPEPASDFKNKMEQKAPQYLKLVTHDFNDKDVDDLIEHFRDKERRKEFFKEYKELEMLLRDHLSRCVSASIPGGLRIVERDLRGGREGVHQDRLHR
jgi:hypothetical protein